MKKYEYKIITIKLEKEIPNEEKILSTLNNEGKSGWLVCSLNVLPRIEKDEDEIKVLLAKEIAKTNKRKAMKEVIEKSLDEEDPASTILRKN